MTRMTEAFNVIVAVSGTACTFLLGGWDIVLKTLVVLMAADYLTGLAKGYITKELSSVTGMKGILKKILILFILIVAVALDRALGTDNCMFRTLVAFFYISNESLSIIENATALGVPVPEAVKARLEQLKDNK